MPGLYAEENFPYPVVLFLRGFGYDVLTVAEAKQANKKIPDSNVWAFATAQQRTVLTINKWHFVGLHR